MIKKRRRHTAARQLARCPVKTRAMPVCYDPGNGNCWNTDPKSSTIMEVRIKVPTIANRLNGTTRSDDGRRPVADQRLPQPSGRTLFSPFRDLDIGASHNPTEG